MVTFDAVLPIVVQTIEAEPGFDKLSACAVVRDLHGRVRLVIDERPPEHGAAPDPGACFDTSHAQRKLKERLRGYFVEPIWSASARGPDEARLARELLKRAQPWDFEYEDPITGQGCRAKSTWKKYERRLSKNMWLDQGKAHFPWELNDGPCITAFYSFKGGIGRTTALASCAWQLAKPDDPDEAGKSVVILDLDLEAPGIGTLLEVESDRGLIDLLVDYMATGTIDYDLKDACVPANVLGAGERVRVLPAGNLTSEYVEKLARLDFTSQVVSDKTSDRASYIEQALVTILQRVRAELEPDHIFLDARSGIHDLSGLSLHRLAHTDVLLSRAGEQSYQGFELTLRSLIRRKGHEKLQCVVVHSMAEPGDRPAAREEREEFLQRVHRIFDDALYSKRGQSSVSLNSPAAPHRPFVIPFNQELIRFDSIASQYENLRRDAYKDLRERIVTLASIESGEVEDEG